MPVLDFLNPVKGFGVTFREMFRKVDTVMYPEDKRPTAPRFHGHHQLNRIILHMWRDQNLPANSAQLQHIVPIQHGVHGCVFPADRALHDPRKLEPQRFASRQPDGASGGG